MPRAIAPLIDEYEAALPAGGWPNWVLGNHDRARIASRVGADQARIAAMLLLTLTRDPDLYYGDEIGMRRCRSRADRVRDPFEKNVPGIGMGRDGAARRCNGTGVILQVSRMRSPGCPSRTTSPARMSRRSAATCRRSSISTGA